MARLPLSETSPADFVGEAHEKVDVEAQQEGNALKGRGRKGCSAEIESSTRYWRGVKAGVQQGLRSGESRVRIRETENDPFVEDLLGLENQGGPRGWNDLRLGRGWNLHCLRQHLLLEPAGGAVLAPLSKVQLPPFRQGLAES